MRRSFLLAAVAAPLFALAQPGTNHSCAEAITLQVSPTNMQTELIPVDGRVFPNAVPDPVTTCSDNDPVTWGWYRFTATATKHWIRTDGQGTDDVSMEVFSGACGSLTSIGCFPPNGPAPALTGLTIGSTYHLRVVMDDLLWCQANTDYCQVWIGVVSAPVHDECAGALELPVITGAITTWPGEELTSLGATQSQAACTGTADDDVWYRFTATHDKHALGTTDLTVADQENVYEWFSGSCGNLTSILCNGPVATGLTPGTSYYIRAHSAAANAGTTVRVLANVYALAPNDECAGALPIAMSLPGEEPHAVWVSTMHASGSTVPCGTRPHDVWLSFTASGTEATAAFHGTGSGYLALFSGSCGALTCVDEDNDQLECTGLTPGATYYLKVGTNLNGRGNAKVYVFEPAPNDACADATVLEVQPEGVFTQGHTFNASERAWYRFTATGERMILSGYTTVGEYPTQAYVYSGTCNAQNSVAQTADISNSLVLPGLVVGQEYHVQVWCNGPPVAFRIALRPALANDGCEGAFELPFSTLEDLDGTPLMANDLAANGTGGCMAGRDLWYRFTATHTSAAFVTARRLGAGTTIELFQGGCAALTSLGCTAGTARATFLDLVVGTEYHIRWSSSSPVDFVPLLLDRPVNDGPMTPLPAPVGKRFSPAFAQFTDFGATPGMPSNCGSWSPDDDTWFTFTATATEHGVIAQQRNMYFEEAALTYPYRIEVFDTLAADLAVLVEHIIGCGASPIALTDLVVGRQYLYRVYSGGSGEAHRSGFVTCYTDGDNNEASGAMPLNYTEDYSAYFNTTGATQSLPGVDCQVDDTADDDIWFKFVATPAVARIVVGYATAEVTIELFSGSPGNLTPIACDGNILELPALTSGQTYYVRVYSWGNGTGVDGRIGLIATPSLTANGCVEESCLGPVLVPNPGIELGGECFIHLSEIGSIEGMGTFLAPGWPRMQHGSSDAFHSCAQFNSDLDNPAQRLNGVSEISVLSRSGKGMGGFVATGTYGAPYYVEYLQAPLAEPLVPGEPYLVSFHVVASAFTQFVGGLGAALSEGPLVSGYQLPIAVEPDVIEPDVIDDRGWTNICGIVVPTAPVDHITIGSFRSRSEGIGAGNTLEYAYYFVDDVVVARVADPGCITSIGDVPPLDEEAHGGDLLRVYPNPANELLNIVADPSLFGQRAVIEVFDATGSRVHAEQVNHFNALQPLDLSPSWKEGLYLVMVRVEGQAPKAARVVVRR
ncbi:MAG TPA: T9SS type A sorting domain-containing protein [Flavobacteriales bacterium]